MFTKFDSENFIALTIVKLRKILNGFDMDSSGTKSELAKRLLDAGCIICPSEKYVSKVDTKVDTKVDNQIKDDLAKYMSDNWNEFEKNGHISMTITSAGYISKKQKPIGEDVIITTPRNIYIPKIYTKKDRAHLDKLIKKNEIL